MILYLKHKAIQHFFWFCVVVVGFLVISVSAVNPLLVDMKAQGEQNQSKKVLLQVYQSMYSYKTENGEFPTTSGKMVKLSKLEELKPYIKNSNTMEFQGEELFVVSNKNKFNIVGQKTLANGGNDIQILDYKKKLCHKIDGVTHETHSCRNAVIKDSLG